MPHPPSHVKSDDKNMWILKMPHYSTQNSSMKLAAELTQFYNKK